MASSCSHYDLNELWGDFVDLHQARRESLGEPGCFADPNFEAFLLAATHELSQQNHAHLQVILYEGSPLASMLLLNSGTTNYMYQSGVDVSRMNLEPGYQVALAAIEASLEDGLRKFDFLRGDEPYKSRWDTTRIPLHRTRWIPRKLRSQVKHNLWLTGRTIKGYLNKPSSA